MISTVQPSRRQWFRRPSTRSVVAGTSLVGSLLVAIGVTLPWLSFFAGLQPVSALGSTNGTLLFIGAGLGSAAGIGYALSGSRLARRALTLIGIALTALTAYLVVQLVATYRDVSADPLVVAQLGPGLAVVGVGALLVLATSFFGD